MINNRILVAYVDEKGKVDVLNAKKSQIILSRLRRDAEASWAAIIADSLVNLLPPLLDWEVAAGEMNAEAFFKFNIKQLKKISPQLQKLKSQFEDLSVSDLLDDVTDATRKAIREHVGYDTWKCLQCNLTESIVRDHQNEDLEWACEEY